MTLLDELRLRWLPPSVRFTRAGAFFSAGAMAVGIAAIHSGNNLLFLLMGGMLGTIAASGIVAGLTLRGLQVERKIVGASPVHLPLLVEYRLHNHNRRIPAFALSVSESGLGKLAYVGLVRPGGRATAEGAAQFEHRGTFALERIVVATAFPFGLFVKEKRFRAPGELIVWPRNNRPIPDLPALGTDGHPAAAAAYSAPLGARGEFRSLREYRAGDDRRDIHWRSTARAGEPVVREYSGDAGADLWLALDARSSGGDAAEAAIEGIASAATAANESGRRFGASIGGWTFEVDQGASHLEAVLDALARLDLSLEADEPNMPHGTLLFSEQAPSGEVVDAPAGVPS